MHSLEESLFVQDRLGQLRNRRTSSWRTRHVLDELGRYVLAEVSSELAFSRRQIQAPLSLVEAEVINDEVITVLALRAALGLAGAALDTWPDTYVWHTRPERIESENGERPKINMHLDTTMDVRDWGFDPTAIILDPMLASGGSAEAVINLVKGRGVKKIIFVSIFAATLGVDHLTKVHPDVMIYACATGDDLNDLFYLVRGPGDLGDNLYPRCPAHLRRERPKLG